MEIKTTKEIQHEVYEFVKLDFVGKADYIVKRNPKKWVAVDDILDWLNSNACGYREYGFNSVDADELIQKINGEQ